MAPQYSRYWGRKITYGRNSRLLHLMSANACWCCKSHRVGACEGDNSKVISRRELVMLQAIAILGGWLLMMGQHDRSESAVLLLPHRRSGSSKPLVTFHRPLRQFRFCA